MQPSLPNLPKDPLTRHDFAWAIGLGLAALGLYLTTPIERIFGDGSMLLTLFAVRDFGQTVYQHALYLPLARALRQLVLALGFSLSPGEILVLLSQLSGAFGIAMAFLVARGLGIKRSASGAASLLLMFSPPIWFFSDTAEVHAPHLAMVGLTAVVTLFGPWRRPVLATLLMAICLPLLFLSHQSGLLLYPAWPLLAQIGRKRVGAPLSLRALLFGVAPAALLALIFAIVLTARMRGMGLSDSLQGSTGLVSAYMKSPLLTGLWQGWLRPLAFLWLPLLFGIRHLRLKDRNSLQSLALAALILPSLAFFISWGVPERGAYSLGTAVFFSALAALGLEPFLKFPRGSQAWRWSVSSIAALVLIQAITARREVMAFDRPEINNETQQRISAVEQVFEGMPEPFILTSLDITEQTVTGELAKVYEVSLRAEMIKALEERASPEAFSERALGLLRLIVNDYKVTIVLDRSYRPHLDDYPKCIPFVNTLEADLLAQFQIEKLPGPGGGFWKMSLPAD